MNGWPLTPHIRSAASAAIGISVAAISATYNMIHPDLAVRQAGRRAFRAIAEFADRLDVRLLTLCTGSRDADNQWMDHPGNQTADAWSDLLVEFAAILPIAEQHNVNLGIEPENANVVNSAQSARKLVDELKSQRIKIVLDPANLVEHADRAAWNGIVESSIELLQDHIALTHAKDRNVDGTVATVGMGGVDFDHFIKSLRSAGFDGPVITHGLAVAEAPAVAKFLNGLIGS